MALTQISNGESGASVRAKLNALFQPTSVQIVATSQSNAVDDADIALGSTSFGTDSITALQAILDMAQIGPLLVIWDGHYSVSGVLSIYGNTKIIGLPGCGVILRDHSNSQVFKNANERNPSQAIVDENIIIENLTINGNGYNTGPTGSDVFDTANNGSAVNGSAQTKRNPIIDFSGVNNLILKDIKLLSGRYWASTGCNLNNAVYENVYVDFGDSSTRDNFNYDGLHFKGGINNLRIINPTLLNCKDDNIAFNAHAQLDIYTEFIGTIKNVYVENVYLDGRAMGIGIYSETSDSAIDNIHIKGIYGQTESHFIRITNGETAEPDGVGVIGTIVVEDCHVEVNGSSTLQNFDALINIRANVDKLVLRNCTRTDFTKAASYIRLSKESTSLIRQLIIDGVQMETTGGTFAEAFLEISEGEVQNCIINNYQHKEATSGINAPIVLLNGGDLDVLNIGLRTLENINSLVTVSSGTLAKIEPMHLGSLAFASLPSAVLYNGSTVYVNNEADGPTLAFSDGTNWIDVRDGSSVTGP